MNLGNDEFDCRFDAAASIGLAVKVGPLPLGCRAKSSGYWIIEIPPVQRWTPLRPKSTSPGTVGGKLNEDRH
jgi:hypothetical protein